MEEKLIVIEAWRTTNCVMEVVKEVLGVNKARLEISRELMVEWSNLVKITSQKGVLY